MRGSPPLHLVLFLIGFGLLAVPLAQLTFARPAKTVGAPVTAADTETPTQVVVRFAHPPQSVSLKQFGGPELLEKFSGPIPTLIEIKSRFRIPAEGIELLVAAKWPEGTPDTAVTVALEPDGRSPQTQARWSQGNEMSEVLEFRWP